MDKTITPEVKPGVTRKKVKVKIKDTGHPASPTEFDFCRKVAEGAELSQTIISRRNPPRPWCITRGLASSDLSSAACPEVRPSQNNLPRVRHSPAHPCCHLPQEAGQTNNLGPRRPVNTPFPLAPLCPTGRPPTVAPWTWSLSETGKK